MAEYVGAITALVLVWQVRRWIEGLLDARRRRRHIHDATEFVREFYAAGPEIQR